MSLRIDDANVETPQTKRKKNKEMALHRNGSHIDDYEYLAMYSDYLRMKAEGEKVAYIVAVLKEKYHVCERKIYKVVKMMGREVM